MASGVYYPSGRLVGERLSDRLSGRVSDRVAGRGLDPLSGRMSDRLSERMSDRLSDRMSDRLSGRFSERLSGRMSDGGLRLSSGHLSGRILTSSGRVVTAAVGSSGVLASARSSGTMQVPSGKFPSGDIAILDSWLTEWMTKDQNLENEKAGASTEVELPSMTARTTKVRPGESGVRQRYNDLSVFLRDITAEEKKRKRSSSLRSHLSACMNMEDGMYEWTAMHPGNVEQPDGDDESALPRVESLSIQKNSSFMRSEPHALRRGVSEADIITQILGMEQAKPESSPSTTPGLMKRTLSRSRSIKGKFDWIGSSPQSTQSSGSPVSAGEVMNQNAGAGKNSSSMLSLKPSAFQANLSRRNTANVAMVDPALDSVESSGSASQSTSADAVVSKSTNRRVKRYRNAQPSKFCHVCSRCDDVVQTLVCSNIADGSCRKVVCERCFDRYGWNWVDAQASVETWTCTHCRQCCPEKARCEIYNRTNLARQIAIKLKKTGIRALTGREVPIYPAAPAQGQGEQQPM